MRAFLSHSSKDKDIVSNVHDGLVSQSTWLDSAEIEWGDLFLEKIAQGIESATDFVLFWSVHASQSEWVRLELNMAFILMLRDRAIRLRVVSLDETEIPLYLQPFHCLRVAESDDPAKRIIDELKPLLLEPQPGVRHRFLNRNGELERIEVAIDDPESYLVVLTGFQGVGKKSLVYEALRRFFQGIDCVAVEVSRGTGFVELAMQLNAAALNRPLEIGLTQAELETQIRLSIEATASSGRYLTIFNAQHWLDEDGSPIEPLNKLIDLIASIPAMKNRPAFVTSTRNIRYGAARAQGITSLHVQGLSDDHMATLLRIWYELTTGSELNHTDAHNLAGHLFGHPIAAKLAAGLTATYGPAHLEEFPFELIQLRRDLANMLVNDIPLSSSSEKLMEAISVIGAKVPTSVLATGTQLNDEELQAAVGQCARAGFLDHSDGLSVHPLLRDYFWRTHLHRQDYKSAAMPLAEAVWGYTKNLETASVEFSTLLPATFRLFALAGRLDLALRIREDLLGELREAAILHYDRRDYALADEYIQHVLNSDPSNWTMRMYRARIRIRQEKWDESDSILEEMINERPGHTAVSHLMGWRHLRAGNLERALEILIAVSAKSPNHVRTLRDGAECLFKLQRSTEALSFIERAKKVESNNPYTLDLESRILESMGKLTEAYDAASLAAIRDPSNWVFHHRLGRIKVALRSPDQAILHFREAHEKDSNQFTPLNSLVAAMLDINHLTEVDGLIEDLQKVAQTPGQRVLIPHLTARHHRAVGDLEKSVEILESEIRRRQNVAPNLGLLAQIRIDQHDSVISEYPATAKVFLEQSRDALNRCEAIDPDNAFVAQIGRRLIERE